MSGSFSLDISRFVAKVHMRQDVVVRRLAFDLFSRVILKTPVDTGRARANWQIGVNTIPHGVVNGVAKGTTRLSSLQGEVSNMVSGGVIYLANNLPYIGKLEYGGYPSPVKKGSYIKGKGYEIRSSAGYSRQAPRGMVGLSIMEVASNIQKALAE